MQLQTHPTIFGEQHERKHGFKSSEELVYELIRRQFECDARTDRRKGAP